MLTSCYKFRNMSMRDPPYGKSGCGEKAEALSHPIQSGFLKRGASSAHESVLRVRHNPQHAMSSGVPCRSFAGAPSRGAALHCTPKGLPCWSAPGFAHPVKRDRERAGTQQRLDGAAGRWTLQRYWPHCELLWLRKRHHRWVCARATADVTVARPLRPYAFSSLLNGGPSMSRLSHKYPRKKRNKEDSR